MSPATELGTDTAAEAPHPPVRTGWRRVVDLGAPWAVFALSAAVFATRVWRPYPWSDEAATTMVVTRRSWQQIAALWQGLDAPHIPYYLVAKAWLGLWSWSGLSPLLIVRLLSVLAMAAAVAGVYRLARREATGVAAMLAAAFMVLLPGVSRQAQDARVYALLVAAVVASWLAWSWWRSRPVGRRRWPAVVWAASVVTAAVLSPFGVLAPLGQYVAHLVLAAKQGVKAAVWAPLAVLVPAALLAAPQLVLGLVFGRGTEQPVPLTLDRLGLTLALVLSNKTDLVAVWPTLAAAVIAVAVAVGGWKRWGELRTLARIAAVWFAVGITGGIGVAVVRPQLLLARYSTPMTAPVSILAGVGTAAILTAISARSQRHRAVSTWLVAGVAVAALVAQAWLALPAQRAMRTTSGHLAVGNALAVIKAFRHDHPGAPVLITGPARQAVFVIVRPEVAAANPLYRIDDDGPVVWPVLRPEAEFLTPVADAPLVLWLHPSGGVTAISELPPALTDARPVVVDHREIRGWDVDTLSFGSR